MIHEHAGEGGEQVAGKPSSAFPEVSAIEGAATVEEAFLYCGLTTPVIEGMRLSGNCHTRVDEVLDCTSDVEIGHVTGPIVIAINEEDA